MSPAACRLSAATGLPGRGPVDRVARVQDPLPRGPVGTEVTEGGAVLPSSAAASPGPVLAVATCCRVGQGGAR